MHPDHTSATQFARMPEAFVATTTAASQGKVVKQGSVPTRPRAMVAVWQPAHQKGASSLIVSHGSKSLHAQHSKANLLHTIGLRQPEEHFDYITPRTSKLQTPEGRRWARIKKVEGRGFGRSEKGERAERAGRVPLSSQQHNLVSENCAATTQSGPSKQTTSPVLQGSSGGHLWIGQAPSKE